MNIYGQRAQHQMQRFQPDQYSQITDPTAHFTELGEEIAVAIDNLTSQLAGPDLPGEEYLEKVARLNSAKNRAIELVWEEFGMNRPGEISREEWEQAHDMEQEFLVEWANRAAIGGTVIDPFEIEDLAQDTMLPVSFLSMLISVASPRTFLGLPENVVIWQQSKDDRWKRFQTEQANG